MFEIAFYEFVTVFGSKVEILKNYHNLLFGATANLKCNDNHILAVPTLVTTTPPPSSFNAGVPLVVLKNGRVQQPRRGSSNSDLTCASTDFDYDDKEEPSIPVVMTTTEEQSLSSSSSLESPTEEANTILDEKQDHLTTKEQQMHFTKPQNEEDTHTEPSTSTFFWKDVQNRTKALETPSSFQRKRTNHY